ncbi:MAG: hypothetical protein PHU80_02760 [Kiritimatiellae bacterium]|nr:hypothetical protein [Kiritimatiellia bacterium]
MKHTLILTAISLLLTAMPVVAQETAAQWAEKHSDALAAVTSASLSKTLAQGESAWQELFASVKTGGISDPLAVTRLAALTQHVMREGSKKQRAAYADTLLEAARKASDADVTCFFLDQLRWCGTPRHSEAISRFEQSDAPGVAALATITRHAVNGNWRTDAASTPPNRYAKLNSDLAALKPRRRMPLLLEAFADPDPTYAGIAMQWARAAGGKSETRAWSAKLLTTASVPHKIMLLDMLGQRGDITALTEIEPLMQDSDDAIAAAAQRAIILLGHAEFADCFPALLHDLPASRQTMTLDNLRLLKTALVAKPLADGFSKFSEPGKRVALELLRERRVKSAAAIGVDALTSADEETVVQGFRLLRETADAPQAGLLTEKLLSSNDKIRPEAQTAFAAAARRDTTSTYTESLLKALSAVSAKQKPVLLETAARIGGAQLLATVEEAAGSAETDTATAAVRALADWADNGSIPALMQHAVTAPDARRQTLAVRGLTKKSEAKDFDKTKFRAVWQQTRTLPGNEEHKKAIDALLK